MTSGILLLTEIILPATGLAIGSLLNCDTPGTAYKK